MSEIELKYKDLIISNSAAADLLHCKVQFGSNSSENFWHETMLDSCAQGCYIHQSLADRLLNKGIGRFIADTRWVKSFTGERDKTLGCIKDVPMMLGGGPATLLDLQIYDKSLFSCLIGWNSAQKMGIRAVNFNNEEIIPDKKRLKNRRNYKIILNNLIFLKLRTKTTRDLNVYGWDS